MSKKARGAFVGRPLPAVRFSATDSVWATGSGPEVRAPADAIALAILGRTALIDRLEGPGAGVLAGWAEGS
jgi:hypothetical protein